MGRKIVLTVLVLLLGAFCASCSLSSGDLEIEAQIIYQVGGPQPVARETFYLLNTGIENLPELDKVYRENFYEKWYDQTIGKTQKSRADFVMQEGRAIWEPHVVQSVKTDFQGRATFENVPPGDYWVFGRTQARGDKHVAWDVKVTVKRGKNKVILSNDNYGMHWPGSGT